MKTRWLRTLARRGGAPGLLVVGACLLVWGLWRRRRATLCVLAALAVVGLWLALRAPGRPAAWAVRDLGMLPGAAECIPRRINAAGQVVGFVRMQRTGEQSAPVYRAFLWRDGRMRDLGTLGGAEAVALGLNDRGEVVGASRNREGDWRAFRWRRGRMEELGTLGGPFSAAGAINTRGDVVGSASIKDEYPFACRWRGGKPEELGTAGRCVFSDAGDINARGRIVGTMSVSWLVYQAFLCRDGRIEEIPPLAGLGNWATAINDRGTVVGVSDYSDDITHAHAFRWRGGKPDDLGTLGGLDSAAFDIDNHDRAVGWAATKQKAYHATLWEGRRIVDLNRRLPRGSGWTLIAACGINDVGQIVGVGVRRGRPRAFLLTPPG